MTQFINTYHLNGLETHQALQSALTINWGRVRGNFCSVGAEPPQPLLHNSQELRQRVEGVLGRMRVAFRHRADYAKIGATQQKEEEPEDECRARFEDVFKINSAITGCWCSGRSISAADEKCPARRFKN